MLIIRRKKLCVFRAASFVRNPCPIFPVIFFIDSEFARSLKKHAPTRATGRIPSPSGSRVTARLLHRDSRETFWNTITFWQKQYILLPSAGNPGDSPDFRFLTHCWQFFFLHFSRFRSIIPKNWLLQKCRFYHHRTTTILFQRSYY